MSSCVRLLNPGTCVVSLAFVLNLTEALSGVSWSKGGKKNLEDGKRNEVIRTLQIKAVCVPALTLFIIYIQYSS